MGHLILCVNAWCGWGRYVAESLKEDDVKRVRIYKEKLREGSIHKLGGSEMKGAAAASAGEAAVREVTGQGLFKKETDLTAFVGMKVQTEDGQVRAFLSSGDGAEGPLSPLSAGCGPIVRHAGLLLAFSLTHVVP